MNDIELKQLEFNEFTIKESMRLANTVEWNQDDRALILYLLGLLAGKLFKENEKINEN